MRNMVLPLLLGIAAMSAAGQDIPVRHNFQPGGLRVPVELSKTVKVEKVHPGDQLQFRMAEAILAGHGTVIPANAKVSGHVITADPAGTTQRSHLSMVLDKAEWKGHTFPLHAYISGFTLPRGPVTELVECKPNANLAYFGGRGNAFPDGGLIGNWSDNCDEAKRVQENAEDALQRTLRGVQLYHANRTNFTVLVAKKNIHLPSGLIIMFRNDEQQPSGEAPTEKGGQ